MPGRKFEQSSGIGYRYSINGQEKEIALNENITSAEFWMYDSRIGRRWNVDPVVKVWESPYASFYGNPIVFSDPNGDDAGKKARKRGEQLIRKNGHNKDYNQSIENDNDGNIRIKESWTGTDGILNVSGQTIKRSRIGRLLNKSKQFVEGVGEGLYETAKFAINCLNPDPEKNSIVQVAKFGYNLVTDPKGTWDQLKQAFRETDWRSPKTWGKIASNVVGVKGIDKLGKSKFLTKTDNVATELNVLDPATNAMRLNPASVRAVVDDGVVFMSSKAWPLKIQQPHPPSLITAGCEDVAKSIQASLGGQFLQITPQPGFGFIGNVEYLLASGEKVLAPAWGHHVAVLRGNRVYDAMTGSFGMPLDEYKAMFTDNPVFSITDKITLK